MTDASMLTATQAARILGVSAWKVKDLGREGKLTATRRRPGGHRRYSLPEVRELARFMYGSEPERHDACGYPFGAIGHLTECLRPPTWGPRNGEQPWPS